MARGKQKSKDDREGEASAAAVAEGSGDRANLLIMKEEVVLNTYDEPSDLGASSGPVDLDAYRDNIKIMMVNESDDEMTLEFDLLHVRAPIANALRRILIAEVPTMAFEKIYLYQNTSVIQDEVLCHRLGLLPIKVDPRPFLMPLEKVIGINENGVDCDEEPQPDPTRNIVFKLDVTCTRNKNAPSTATEPHQLYVNSNVYSKHFNWVPAGEQEKIYGVNKPCMVGDDILVAKLRPGQQIEASCHAVKGIGRDHAKFSPVATASYRLLPVITLLEDVTGEKAHRLKSTFSKGVIEIKHKNGEDYAVVKDARRDTCSRNVLRHEDLAPLVELGRVKDHFIFSVESTGALKSSVLILEACKVMQEKCKLLASKIKELQPQ